MSIEVKEVQRPTIGRIVHFVLANGQHRAAMVTNAWDSPSDHPDHCNLTVFLDQSNDLEVHRDALGANIVRVYAKNNLHAGIASDLNNGTLAAGSVRQDEADKAPGTWHWPERA
ncbi:hypothetical protein [Deinococcus humi]|uniref:Uncharacterized protein n=1 Tax=Deinococcus humi TaxID=662880 RepID=A0A7W8JR64_9DEIO|nr:hypothetical protein [Deinococcus humi]MBB5361343.1 hypothetical protein [Deinococcus humi]GGO19555.1 hypothetical protein GCM10008949_04070 [Deinococcus humi]